MFSWTTWTLITVVAMPIMMLLLFVYVFGGAMVLLVALLIGFRPVAGLYEWLLVI